jgi:hypothetical protein
VFFAFHKDLSWASIWREMLFLLALTSQYLEILFGDLAFGLRRDQHLRPLGDFREFFFLVVIEQIEKSLNLKNLRLIAFSSLC